MAVGDTPTYTPSPPTIGPQTEDGRNIVDWVSRELHNISTNLGAQTRLQITPVSAPPPTPREGLVAYADGISWNPNSSGKGLTVYDAAIASWIQFPQLQVQTIGDANYDIRPQDELIIITGFTAPRTWTLPPPSTFAGRELIITGIPGALSVTNTLTIQHNAAEFIDQPQLGLSGTTAVINTPMPYVRVTCDGFNWFLIQLVPTVAPSDPVFIGSGVGHAAGDVPDPGAVAGTTRFLREDATWATVPNGRVLLNTLTASTSASLQDTTSFTASFDDYEIVFENILVTSSGTSINLTVQSGGSFQATGYVWNSQGWFGVNAVATTNSTSDTKIPMWPTGLGLNTTGGGMCGELRIYSVNQTTAPKPMKMDFTDDFTTYQRGFVHGAWRGGNGAITGLKFTPVLGNLASGKIKIFGLL